MVRIKRHKLHDKRHGLTGERERIILVFRRDHGAQLSDPRPDLLERSRVLGGVIALWRRLLLVLFTTLCAWVRPGLSRRLISFLRSRRGLG